MLTSVLPIVLYNGAARWTAPEELAALIQLGPRALQRYQPQVRYLLIDERRYAERELAPLRNLVAALFRLENNRSDKDVHVAVKDMNAWR